MLRNATISFGIARRVIPQIKTLSYAMVRQPMVPGRIISTRFYGVTTDGKEIPDEIDQLSAEEYHSLSDEYLEGLLDQLEGLCEEHPQIDVELSQGVMTLELPPNGTYVINKQPPNKQIWWSSPISGPKRFDLIGGEWRTLRDSSSLSDLIDEELKLAFKSE